MWGFESPVTLGGNEEADGDLAMIQIMNRNPPIEFFPKHTNQVLDFPTKIYVKQVPEGLVGRDKLGKQFYDQRWHPPEFFFNRKHNESEH